MVNEDIIREIQKADFQGKTPAQMKPLYIKKNTFGVALEKDIFRIFQAPFFLDDVIKPEISLVNIHPLVFGDPYENPLLDKTYELDGGGKFTLNGVIKNYYGLSWTEEAKDETWRWKCFTHGKQGVRIKASLCGVMNELTNTNDKFFMLHYHVGKVTYQTKTEIDNWVQNSPLGLFLDPQGQAFTLSLVALRKDFQDEKEIRILYSYMPKENDFVTSAVRIENQICKHPFDWKKVIQEVLIDPRMSDHYFTLYKESLINAGILCPINRSSVTL